MTGREITERERDALARYVERLRVAEREARVYLETVIADIQRRLS